MADILAHDWLIIALPLPAPAFCMPHATLFLQPEASVGSPSEKNPESYPHPSQKILVSYKDHRQGCDWGSWLRCDPGSRWGGLVTSGLRCPLCNIIELEKNIHWVLSSFNAHPPEWEKITLLKVYPALSSKPFHGFLAERTLKTVFVHPSLSCFLGLTDARLIHSTSCKVRENIAMGTHFPRASHIPTWHLVALLTSPLKRHRL